MLVSPFDPEQHNRRRQAMKLISNALTIFIIAALAVIMFHGKLRQQASTDLSEDELECLVSNVYHESRGESLIGQAAVAHITLNRVRAPAYPDSVCGVVWQKGQFSWTEDGRSDRMTDLDAIGKAVDIVLAASRAEIKDPTGGALHFYAHDKVKPRWAKAGYGFILGEHTFVKLVGR
jgi:spore germination cell wall hydrolase CwlJ-like protein